MATNVTIESYTDETVAIAFEMFEDDGVTPLNLIGGSADLIIKRSGLKPFVVHQTSETPGFTWSNQAGGKGTFVVDTTDLPSGWCRYQLTGIKAGDVASIQAAGWLKLSQALKP